MRKYTSDYTPRLVKQGLYDPSFEHDACGVGLVANIKGVKSHKIISQGLEVLINLGHRGACGADPETGDGAGLLIQMPHDFLVERCGELGIPLPGYGDYGVGMVFLPQDAEQRRACEETIERIVRQEGHSLLGWRDVPVAPDAIGTLAARVRPFIRQFFVSRSRHEQDQFHFELRLYVIRKQIERAVAGSDLSQREDFYIPSLSSNKVVYKGLIMADQLEHFYLDLADESMVTSFALVHSRFSTNTLGSWKLAHPYRFVIHNGEINTLRGNINWMAAREAMFSSSLLGRRRQEAAAHHDAGTERHRQPRQRPGASPGHRQVPATLDDDAHPRGVGRPPPHGPSEEGVLRVPLVPDGAVGRARPGDRHRRLQGVRHPGQEWPTPLPVPGHLGRPAGDGLGNGRPGRPARGCAVQGADIPRAHVHARHGGGANHRRRRAQGGVVGAEALRPLAQGAQGHPRRSAGARRRAGAGRRHPQGEADCLRVHAWKT